MWKNIVQPVRPQMTIWRMRIANQVPEATNTLSEFVILIDILLQQRLHERGSMLRHRYIACLVYSLLYVRSTCLCDTHQKQILKPKRRRWSKSSCDGPNKNTLNLFVFHTVVFTLPACIVNHQTQHICFVFDGLQYTLLISTVDCDVWFVHFETTKKK